MLGKPVPHSAGPLMSRPTVEELVESWMTARRQGVEVTIEQLCRDCPDLTDEVRRRVRGADHAEPCPTSLGGYRVERVLGVGGMGAVYLGHDDRLDRAVALKTLKRESAAAPGATERFLREARAAAAVEHDNIIAIWQVGEDHGIPFIAMPFLQGESLVDRLKRERVPALGVTLKVGREVAAGLAAAHDKGLIHRDIKPGNVWLEGNPRATDPDDRFRRCKILDFGIARPAGESRLTQTGAILGTPSYMAPEQARGLAVDVRTDLFSLGAMLYEMLTGELPFPGDTMPGVLLAVVSHDPPPPATRNRSVPPVLSDLVMRLLAKDAALRPTSAKEVAAALAAIERQSAGWSVAPAPSVAVVYAPPATTVGPDPWTQIAPAAAPAAPAAGARPSRKPQPSGGIPVWVWVSAAALALMVGGGIIIRNARDTDGPDGTKSQTDRKGNPRTTSPKTVPTGDPDRRAALWVLSRGGWVSVWGSTDGGKQVKAAADLPARPFQLGALYLPRGPAPLPLDELVNLRGLTALRVADFGGTELTDEGLATVGDIASLETLYLNHTRVTTDGLIHLARLTKLTDLRLDWTKVTGPGLSSVKGLTALTKLNLEGTDVSDFGLDHLRGLTALRELRLESTKVTPTGFATLRTALPNCTITPGRP